MKKLIAPGLLLIVLLGWALFYDLPDRGQAQIIDLGTEGEMTGTDREPSVIDVPVLLYHHISDTLAGCTSEEKFLEDMLALKEAGYETVFFEDLYQFVYRGGDLPENPVVVSFDDGYLSNYEIVFPILQELGMKAEIAVIGALIGESEDASEEEELGYFSWNQAKEMQESGQVRIQSHTYKLHQSGITGESEAFDAVRGNHEELEAYVKVFMDDDKAMRALMERNLGKEGVAFVYPFGKYDETTEALLHEMGYRLTVGATVGINRLERGDADSLKMLYRIVCDDYSGSVADLINYIKRVI